MFSKLPLPELSVDERTTQLFGYVEKSDLVFVSGLVATQSELSCSRHLEEQLQSVPNIRLLCKGPFWIIYRSETVEVLQVESWIFGERPVVHVFAKYGCRTVSGIVFQVQNREGESLLKWEHRDHVEFLTDLKNAYKRIRELFAPDLLFSGGNLFMGLLGFTISKSRIRGIQFVHWMGMFGLFMEKTCLFNEF